MYVGLNVDQSPAADEKRKKKEQKWVGNFQEHAYLSGEEIENNEKNTSNATNTNIALKSPNRFAGGTTMASSAGGVGTSSAYAHTLSSFANQRMPSPSHPPPPGMRYGAERKYKEYNINDGMNNGNNENSFLPTGSSKCSDDNICIEDLVMMGLYRLDERQEQIYRNFVEMISGFDEYDKVCEITNYLYFLFCFVVYSFCC